MIDQLRAALGLPATSSALDAPAGSRLYGPPLPDPEPPRHTGPPQMVALPAVIVTAGPQIVQLPDFCREGGQLRLANNGPFDLVIQYGATSRNLVHGLVDVIDLPPESLQLAIMATLAPGAVSTAAALLLDFAYPGERIEGTYPQVMTGATVSVGNTPNVVVSNAVNIGNTPAVTISGTPNVNVVSGTVAISGTPNVSIASGTVAITGTPVVNVQAANGVTILGPNLMPAGVSGPMVAGWADFGTGITSVAFLTGGPMEITATAANPNGVDAGAFSGTTGAYALRPVNAGEHYHLEADWFSETSSNTARVWVNFYAADLANHGSIFGSFINAPVNTWVTPSMDFVVPPNCYYMQVVVGSGSVALNDKFLVARCLLAISGSFSVNAQQGQLPVVTHVNVCDLEVTGFGAAGAQASVDFAAVAGKSLVFQIVTGALIVTGAGGASGSTFAIHTGLNLLPGNAQWGRYTGVTATVGDKDIVHATDLGIRVPQGSASRVGFEVAVPGCSQSVSAGAYLV